MLLAVAAVSFARAAAVHAQAAPAQPAAATQVRFVGSLRLRSEAWGWFDPTPPADGDYAYLGSLLRGGLTIRGRRYDAQLELAAPALLGLPDDATAPPPQGQLGLGAAYRTESGDRKIGLVPKQAFLRLDLGSRPGSLTLRGGRFEVGDAMAPVPADPALRAIKQERIANRLIGTFGFTHVQRSFDGIELTSASARTHATLLGFRPTQGVFQLNGLGEVNVEVAYGALTFPHAARANAQGQPITRGEGRVFAMYYDDGRSVVKTDNRPAPVRTADQASVRVATLGGHYLRTFPAGQGQVDLTLWGAVQTGKWGALDHRAGAALLELGYQPPATKVKPWFRAGYYLSSGDGDAADDRHGTFFVLLPTPRAVARFPFYNHMNLEDLFGEVRVATGRWSFRAEGHGLWLRSAADLWYVGGGAFDNQNFGVGGRPSGGNRSLARVLDLSADVQIDPRTGIGAYVARAFGGAVAETVYPLDKSGMLAFLELRRQF
jgi:hypothetical protein